MGLMTLRIRKPDRTYGRGFVGSELGTSLLGSRALPTLVWLKVDPEAHRVQAKEQANRCASDRLSWFGQRLGGLRGGGLVEGEAKSTAGRHCRCDELEPQQDRCPTTESSRGAGRDKGSVTDQEPDTHAHHDPGPAPSVPADDELRERKAHATQPEGDLPERRGLRMWRTAWR